MDRKLHKETILKWVCVVVFAITFAWVEGSVVVYLREIYYEGNFTFPIYAEWENDKIVYDEISKIELAREIATIIMLLAVGYMAGRIALERFCFFMIAFGTWDIFYYIWLWVMVRWPENLMAWDILFLIPLPWVGPIITPALIAVMLIFAGSIIIYLRDKGYVITIRWFDWVIELICALSIIVAFCWDWKNIIRLPGEVEYSGLPNPFAWWLYLPAYIMSLVYFIFRLKQVVSENTK